MLKLTIKVLAAVAIAVCGVLAIIHAFPVIFVVLAIIGIHKVYQVIKRPNPPGDWW